MAGDILRIGSGTLDHASNSLGTNAVEGGPDRGVGSVAASRGRILRPHCILVRRGLSRRSAGARDARATAVTPERRREIALKATRDKAGDPEKEAALRLSLDGIWIDRV